MHTMQAAEYWSFQPQATRQPPNPPSHTKHPRALRPCGVFPLLVWMHMPVASRCELNYEFYGHMTARLRACAAAGRIVLCLEGGYNTSATAECAAQCVKVLLGAEPELLPRCGRDVVITEI